LDKLLLQIDALDDLIADYDAEVKAMQKSLKQFKAERQELADKVTAEMQDSGVLNSEVEGVLWSLRYNPKKPIITDESKIPDKYMRIKKEINKVKINEDMASGTEIEGVAFDNGSVSLVKKGK